MVPQYQMPCQCLLVIVMEVVMQKGFRVREALLTFGVYRPFHTGLRFSANACAPSSWSSLL